MKMLQVNQQVICRTDRVLYCLIKNQEASEPAKQLCWMLVFLKDIQRSEASLFAHIDVFSRMDDEFHLQARDQIAKQHQFQ
jgi:hypothetical protein